MAVITEELQTISTKRYGEEVRGAVHDSIEKINNESTTAESVAISDANSIHNLRAESDRFYDETVEAVEGAMKTAEEIQTTFSSYTTWPKEFSIEDENDDPIVDENGNPIGGTIIFFVKQ